MDDLTVAISVMNCEPGRPNINFERMEGLVNEAASIGAQLVCFPEASLTGYGFRPEDSGIAIGLEDTHVQGLKSICEAKGISIAAGFLERTSKGFHLTHVLLSPTYPMRIYRKIHPGPPERGFITAGESIEVFPSRGAVIGLGLCYDAHFPELSLAMAVLGAEVLIFPHASPGDSPDEKLDRWMRYMPARAVDNGSFVIAFNQVGDGLHGLRFPGVALALDPRGRVILSYCSMEERLLFVTLKASELEELRSHPMGYFLPSRRPEVYGKVLSQAHGG